MKYLIFPAIAALLGALLIAVAFALGLLVGPPLLGDQPYIIVIEPRVIEASRPLVSARTLTMLTLLGSVVGLIAYVFGVPISQELRRRMAPEED